MKSFYSWTRAGLINFSVLDYVDSNLPLPNRETGDNDEVVLDDKSFEECGLVYTIGDVTKPKLKSDDNSDHAVIAHVVDDSGMFISCLLFPLCYSC